MAPGRKDLTAAKFALLEAMAVDQRLTAFDIRVGTLLVSRYLNSETREAWPSPVRLANELQARERSVRRSLKRLCDNWWRQTKKGGGTGRTSHYAPRWETVTHGSGFDHAQTVTRGSANSDRQVRQTVTARSGEPSDRNPIMNPLKERSDSQNLNKGFNESIAPSERTGSDDVNGTGSFARPQSKTTNEEIDIDWDDWKDWFRTKGEFEKRNGYGASCYAGEIIEKLRSAAGDQAAFNCLKSGKEKNFFGEVLEKHVQSAITWHENRSGRSKW